ncbi:MAG: ABC-2 family transporter protein [Candidatus Riflebacteria bacterium]|nr:ABC-2 family transporter protein [Candidatus Riflebacteria bacterium]
MNSILNGLRLYCRYVSISIRSQMEYKASFLMFAVGQFFLTLIDFVGVWALFDRFGSLQGWRLAEVALFYGVVNVAFALAEAFARGFDTFEVLVRDGTFDRMLLRPRSTVLQVTAQELQLFRVGRLLQGLMVLVGGLSALQVDLGFAQVALLAASIFGGACIFSGLFVLQATLAIWTTSSLEVVNTVTYGGVETAQYPLSIYRPWFRSFFTFVIPLACINYLPLHAVLDRADPLGSPTWLQWAAPFLGVLFLAAALQFWRFGVRHYRSTGS